MPIAALLTPGDGTVPAPVCKVYAVSKTGTQLAELDNANVTSVEWELNTPGSARIEIHTEDPDALNLGFATEVQVWWNGSCKWWGYVSRIDANKTTVTFECKGLLGYLDRRFFGKADRTNLLSNPEFEGGSLSPWATSGAATATQSTTRRVLGTKSLKLVQSAEGIDTYEYQNVSVTGTGVGSLLTVAAWFWLDDTGYIGPAFDSRGLFIEMENGATVEDSGEFSIDDDTPRNSWQRAEATVWIPPNLTRTINVRLYAPGGTIYWDAVSLTAMESFSFYNLDQATIAEYIVAYAQDHMAWDHEKSDLLISTGVAYSPLTGITRDYHQQFAEHANIGGALHQFAELDDGFDMSVEHNSWLRTFNTWYPNKGTDRGGTPDSGISTVTISNSDLAADSPFGWRFDGEQAASMVTVIGEGDGPDREEGGAQDLAAFGATTFEDVSVAQPATPIDRLDALADERLRALKNPESITFTVHELTKDLLKTVVVGDTIDLDIDHGYIQAIGDYRVVAMRFAPVNAALSLECNAA